MPRGTVLSYDEERAFGFIVSDDEPNGAAVRFTKRMMKLGNFRAGDRVEFDFGIYRGGARHRSRGPTAAYMKLIDDDDDDNRRDQHVTTLFGEYDYEWF
jgi:cold shock CspA family protein